MTSMLPELLSTRKVDSIREEWIRVSARMEEKKARLGSLEVTVGQAKHRIAQRPMVEAVLEEVQRDSHARGIGMYESLLTMFNKEILPEIKKPVVMDLTTERGLPALSIAVGHGEQAEDLWEGGGGSLTNSMSLGLRYISLARSPLRKFMVLDEPDCWLESDRIPDLGRIVVRMSSRLNIQTLLVTHHRTEIVNQIKDRIQMDKDAILGVRISYPNGLPTWNDTQIGIRKMELVNVMSHSNSVLHLSPETTLITGPNHTGKSVPFAALRALTKGKATDKMIRDGKDFCMVVLHLEEGRRLRWTRRRGDVNPKEVYDLFEAGDAEDSPSRSARGIKGSVPDFVREVLNIQQVQDLDIQLHHQKLPTFLLDKPASQQASILSAGMESEHLDNMMREYKAYLSSDKKEVELGEREMADLKKTIEAFNLLFADDSMDLDGLRSGIEKLEASMLSIKDMENLVGQVETLTRRIEICSGVKDIEQAEVPVLENASDLANDVVALEKLESRMAICAGFKDIEILEAPTIENSDDLASDLDTIEKVEARVAIYASVGEFVFPEAPELMDAKGIESDLSKMDKANADYRQASAKASQSLMRVDAAKSDLEIAMAKIGHVCPVCHQGMTVEHLSTH